MTIDHVINILVTITLIVMMAAVGLAVTFNELMGVARSGRLVAKATLANYVCVPAATVGLLLLFRAQPMVSAGFLMLAVCPGAPFGPPCTAIAKGNVPASAGLMVILAGSSALVAPLLLGVLLPLMSGNEPLKVDSVRLVGTLLVTQLIPLCVGLTLRQWRPALAIRLRKPANYVSALLNLTVAGLILATQFETLAAIHFRAWGGMAILLIVSLATGWLLGGPGTENRSAMTLTTSLRNVGVALVIATSSFPGTSAVTATLAYGLFEIFGSLLLAFWWGRPLSVQGRKIVKSGNSLDSAASKGMLS
jgi:bile acid:Na+ symporter, BASS family